MKVALSLCAAALCLGLIPARAGYTIDDSSYGLSSYYVASGSNSIVSYDWDATNNLYYQEATPSYNFGGFYQYNGTTTTTLSAASSDFSGASVVAVGNYVYYNSSDSMGNENIYQYGPTGAPALTLSSTATNYGLYSHGGQLYITGSTYDPVTYAATNHLYSTTVNATTGAISSTAAFESDSGGSGPLAFDNTGNLYYAPGYGDLSIYKWSASDVAAALADPVGHALTTTGHQWADYSSTYSSVSGGTSILVNGGQLLLTLTSFSDPSILASFGIDPTTGAFTGSSDKILDSTDILGELRSNGGSVYVSDGSSIYQVTAAPEPASYALLGIGLVALVLLARRRIA